MFNRRNRVHSTLAGLASGIALAAIATPTLGQTELAKLTASDAATSNNFGNSVSICPDWALVGSRQSAPRTSGQGAGAAYFYERNGNSWGNQIRVVANDRLGGDHFGASVAVDGNWAVVGAPDDIHLGTASGSAYIYMWNGTTWGLTSGVNQVQNQKVVGSGRINQDRFGTSVAIDGDTIIVGADQFFNSVGVGKAYVFRLVAGTWTEEAVLSAPDAAVNDKFGTTVAISGDTALIGAPRIVGFPTATDTGSAYVFTRSGTTWSFQSKLTPSDGGAGDTFARFASLNGDVAVLGSELNDDGGSNAGAAYAFRRSGATWTEEAKLVASDPQINNSFGNSVAVSGNSIAVGCFLDASQTGSVYLFNYSGSSWAEITKIFGSDSNNADQFSRGSLAMEASTAIVGAAANEPIGESVSANHGAAYIFDTTVAADVDNDGDGLFDSVELELAALNGNGCPDPLDPDSDNDGLSDGHENDFGPNMCNADVDGDGLSDGVEFALANGSDCPNFSNEDSDGDGLDDGAEINAGLDPCDGDSDDDALSDGLEIAFGSDGLDTDSDDDGLTDGVEVATANGSGCPNPMLADSDGDELSDGVESGSTTQMCNADSDSDGLSDSNESNCGTSPTDPDCDDDDLLDGEEVTLAAGGGCPSPLDPDSDADGVTDGNELTAGLGPCDDDSDDDGLADGNEAGFGTGPLNPDSDGDGLLDGTEVDIAQGTGCPNPLVGDSDGDTLADFSEVTAGTNPCSIDTDGDSVPDNVDPTPNAPGVPPGFLSSMALATAADVQGLHVSSFLAPNANAQAGRRNALNNNLTDAAVAIQQGNYQAALASLMMVSNKVDGVSPPPDWMPDSPAKTQLYEDVQTLIVLVQLLMGP